MKQTTPRNTAVRLARLVAAAGFLSTAAAHAATIEGRVLNAATGVYLNNARIVVEGSNVETYTDGNGDFRLAGLPAGEVKLRVTYAGFEPRSAVVKVADGAPARRDFELEIPRDRTTAVSPDVVRLGSFIVESTQLSAQAAAINEQKVSPN
ncbi:MAG: carboxypeptidase regulatory-like domain-containing protein, partial [Opitutaceae bacterium]